MPEEKPNLSELYKSGGLDLDLVNKIAYSELEKSKGSNFNSVEALASEYIGVYTYPTASRIIESYIEVLDSELTTEDYQGGKISPEFMLGAAIARGAVAHAQADIEYWENDIFSRAVTALDDVGLADAARFSCKNADEFSLAGVNPDTKFPIGFVSVREVADTVGERGSEHTKETLKPAASSDMSSPTASRSMQNSRWRKSTSNRAGRASMRSAMRKARKPSLPQMTRQSNTVRQAMSRANNLGG